MRACIATADCCVQAFKTHSYSEHAPDACHLSTGHRNELGRQSTSLRIYGSTHLNGRHAQRHQGYLRTDDRQVRVHVLLQGVIRTQYNNS